MSAPNSNTAWHQYTGTPTTNTTAGWSRDRLFDLTAQHFDRFVPVRPKGSRDKDGKPTDKLPWAGYCLLYTSPSPRDS